MLLQAFSLSGVSLPLLLSVESGISKHDIIYYVCAGILTLLVLVGIAMMSKVEKAVAGNRLGAVSMLLAILLTLWYFDIFSAVEFRRSCVNAIRYPDAYRVIPAD